jgi:hypothetical protein
LYCLLFGGGGGGGGGGDIVGAMGSGRNRDGIIPCYHGSRALSWHLQGYDVMRIYSVNVGKLNKKRGESKDSERQRQS